MRTIPLYGKKASGHVALVDDADYELVAAYRWHIQAGRNRGGPYAITHIYRVRRGTETGAKRTGYWQRRTTISMHKLITGWPATDHKDHDGLNNQRSNLRPSTPHQNSANSRKTARATTSRFKGVSFNRKTGAWHASIRVHSKARFLGRFASEEAAAHAYDAAAREAFGEFACLNFPERAP